MKNILTKYKKPIIIGGSILAVAIIIYFIARKKKVILPGTESSVSGSPATGVVFPIKRKLGAETNEAERVVVANIQRYLNDKITFVEIPLVIDGIFGEKTEAMSQRILGVKTISYSLYKEILAKVNPSPFLSNIVK